RELPFSTWTKAQSVAQPGDVIYFRGGVYTPRSTIILSKSGMRDAPIAYFAYPGEKPVIDLSGLPSGSIGIWHPASWVHVKGFEIKNAPSIGYSMYAGQGQTAS